MMCSEWSAACVLLWLTTSIPATLGAQGSAIDTLAIQEHVRFLASDRLEGRANGTLGQQTAAQYIENRLRAMGIRGGGASDSYRQPLPLSRVDVDETRSRLIVSTAAGSDTSSGADFQLLSGSEHSFRDFGGRVAYFGRSEDAVRLLGAVGSLAGVVVALEPGGTSSDAALALIQARGAAGVMVLGRSPQFYARLSNARGRPRWFLRAAVRGSGGRPLPIAIVSPRVVQHLNPPLPMNEPSLVAPLDLGRNARIELRSTTRDVDAANMVAVIDGKDPTRRHEAIVLVAHYDHIGFARAVDGDSLYNGFMDNAVGVAAVLAIADVMRREPLSRSVILLFTAAEEEGLLGSAYYVEHPVVPLARTVAVINLDHPAPLAPPRIWFLESNSDALVELGRVVARERDWVVEGEPLKASSDHWSFGLHGVPSVFIVSGEGWEGMTLEAEEKLIARWWRPHHPDDEWSPDFPLAGLARVAEFALRLGRAFANTPIALPGGR